MSKSTIEQLFKIATPPKSNREPIRDDQQNSEPFRAHLDRAAGADELPPLAPKDESKPTLAEEEQAPETQTDQGENLSREQDETVSASETAENTIHAEEEKPIEDETDDATDDVVTLSVAATAGQQTEIVIIEPEVVVEAIVVSTSSENQQQTEGQQASTNADETPEETTASTNNTTEIETSLLGTAQDSEDTNAGEHANEAAQQKSDTTKETTNQATQQATQQAVITTTVGEGEAKKTQATSVTNTTSTLAEQQKSADALEALPGSDTVEPPKKAEAKTPETTVFNPPTTGKEADLLEAELNSSAEVSVNSSTTSTATSSSGENLTALERALPTSLNGKASESAQATEANNSDAPTVDRARFIRRVGGAIRSAQLRGRPIQLQLSPPELGTLKIELTVVKGVMTAKLEVESVAARAVILDNLPALRERLADQQISIEKFDVDVGQDDQQTADFSENKERQEQRAREQANKLSFQANNSTTPVATTAPVTAPIATPTGLDIRI